MTHSGSVLAKRAQKGSKNHYCFHCFLMHFHEVLKPWKTIRKTWFCEGWKSRSGNLINTEEYLSFWMESFSRFGPQNGQKPLGFLLIVDVNFAFKKNMENH